MQAGFKLSERYVLQELLGGGGMGEVWRGVDERLDRAVAVKVLREHLANPELAERFQREARLAARLQHPGITVVHDIGSDNGQVFIVMELLCGRDLATMLAEAPAGLPVDAAISLTLQAAEALQAAHAGRVIHRDLKPANLFVLDSGHLKICDFGIAWAVDATTRLTATGQAIGTPAYMSPEQCRGEQVDEPSDLYSLGCVLCALLTGRPPFDKGEPLAIMYQHLSAAPAAPQTLRPDVPPELDDLVLDLLAKDPARRPAHAGYVIAALRALCHTPTAKVEPTAKAHGTQPDGPHEDNPANRTDELAPRRPPAPVPALPSHPVRTLTGHTGGVQGVAFSPDGRLLATASRDGTARLWDPATGELLGTLASHTGDVNGVAFSPGGRLLATAGWNGARLWDLATSALLRTLTGHIGGVQDVAFSPDGRLLATASTDGTARLWDPANPATELLRTLIGHASGVTGVAFSPDGRLVATASDAAQLWHPATGGCLGTLTGHASGVTGVAFSPDGRLLATASRDGTARLWDPATGGCLGTLTGHASGVTGVAFSPDGRLLATASGNKTAVLWD